MHDYHSVAACKLILVNLQFTSLLMAWSPCWFSVWLFFLNFQLDQTLNQQKWPGKKQNRKNVNSPIWIHKLQPSQDPSKYTQACDHARTHARTTTTTTTTTTTHLDQSAIEQMHLIQTFKTHYQYVPKPVQPSHCTQHMQQPKPHGRTKINPKLARFQASATQQSRPLFFWDVWWRTLVITDVSGQRISPILKGQAFLILDSVKLSLIAYFTSLIVVDDLLLQIQMTHYKAHRTTNTTAQNQQHPLFHCIFKTP
jgi:hypothetical protein